MDWKLECKPCNCETSRKKWNTRKKLLDIGLGNNFFDWYQKHRQKSYMNKQIRACQTKNLHSKENNQENEKAISKREENTCKLYI